jgi:hypothetical protein
MKKRLAVLSLAALLSLAGCGSSNININAENPSYSPKNLVSINAKDYNPDKNNHSITSFVGESAAFDSALIVTTNYAYEGLLVVKNANGLIGFYSLAYNKYLVNPTFESANLTYQVYNNNYLGYLLMITYNSSNVLLDACGNLLFAAKTTDKQYQGISFSTIRQGANQVLSATVSYINLTTGQKQAIYYVYENHVASRVDALPSPYYEGEIPSQTTIGSTFIGTSGISLTEYGADGYYLLTNETYASVYKSDGTLLSSFAIPNSGNTGIVGTTLIYQDTTQVADQGADYDYSVNGNKYVFSSKSINMLTGKTSNLSLNYILTNSITSYKDKDGKYTIGIAKLKKIGAKKALENMDYECLINKEGKIVQDVTGFDLGSFVKLKGGNYYNTTSKILFDTTIQPLAYLSSMNPSYYASCDAFIGYLNSSSSYSHGMVDSSGKVIANFLYNSIDPIGGNGHYIGSSATGFVYTSNGEAVRSSTVYQVLNGLYETSVTSGATTSMEFFNASTSFLKISGYTSIGIENTLTLDFDTITYHFTGYAQGGTYNFATFKGNGYGNETSFASVTSNLW